MNTTTEEETNMATKTLLLLIVCIGIVQATAIAQTQKDTDTKKRGEKQEAVAEALIRQRVEDYVKAIRAKDIDRVMSLYAPNIVSFDLNPPLRYAGTDNKRRAWQEFFATYTGAVVYDLRDLNVTTNGELAFVHSLNHVKGALASGHIIDLWVRWTACFRRIDGVWLIVHDHVSVPADLEHGKVVLHLTP
jgi:ketosteroid isomerase-like protein